MSDMVNDMLIGFLDLATSFFGGSAFRLAAILASLGGINIEH